MPVRALTSSLVESLAFVHFVVAEHGDVAGLTPDERARIRETLVRWLALGNAVTPEAQVDAAMDSVWAHLKNISETTAMEALKGHVGTIRMALPEDDHRKAVLYDMASVSRADGSVTLGERAIVATVQRMLLA